MEDGLVQQVFGYPTFSDVMFGVVTWPIRTFQGKLYTIVQDIRIAYIPCASFSR